MVKIRKPVRVSCETGNGPDGTIELFVRGGGRVHDESCHPIGLWVDIPYKDALQLAKDLVETVKSAKKLDE